ncbi:MAG: baseplate J/gp47 family protein [Phycisphaerales bacterium JB052]
MSPIELPQLDPRDESEVVADVIDSLPAELSDRNASAPEVKLIEAVGAMYGVVLYMLAQVPYKLQLAMLNLLGLQPKPAESSMVTLEFTRTSTTTIYTIPAGTIVKTSTGVEAIKFATVEDLTFQVGEKTLEVNAEALEPGARANVGANTLKLLDEPLSALESVNNPASAAGGLDEEPIAALEARAPLAIRAGERAITDEDFQLHAETVAGVRRAIAFVSPGAAVVHILNDTLNEAPNNTLVQAVKAELESRTLASVAVTILEPPTTLVRITKVELELEDDAPSILAMLTAVHQRLAEAITADHIYAPDGYTVEHPGWPWGRNLYANQLVVALGDLEGVVRVGRIYAQWSNDYGQTWSPVTPGVLNQLEPSSPNYGLMQYDTSYNPSIVEL